MRLLISSLIVVALAVGLAIVIKGDADPSEPSGSSGGRTQTFAPTKAAFYLDLDTEAKVAAVRKTMRHLTSGAAAALGAVKEDVALLADEPEVITAILEAYASRGSLTRFEGAAFGDLFELIKHSRFVDPVIAMFTSPFPDVRNKAIRASATQADPRLVPHLDRIYDEALAAGPQRGSGSRERVIYAAEVCGGDLLLGLLRKGLSDPAVTVRSYTVDVVGRLKIREFIPELRPFTRARDPHLRIVTAMALARMDDETGLRVLLDLLDPRDPNMSQDAAQAIRELRLDGAIPALKSLLESSPLELRPALAGTLVVLGDDETLQQLVGEMRHPNDFRRLTAITAVAASGAAEYREDLLAAVRREGASCHRGVSLGLAWAPYPDIELAKLLIKESPRPDLLIEVALRLGDALPRWLEGQLAAAQGEPRIIGLVALLSLLGTATSREVLLNSRGVHLRLVSEGIRMLDLRSRRKGLTW